MLTRFRWIVPFIMLVASNALVKAQTTDTLETKVINRLTTYYKKYPQEKIYIHTSQQVYTGGQTLWYKLYAMAYGKPSPLSKIVYVQLVNGAGKVVINNKRPLKDGAAYGNLDLPDSLKTGWYQLKGFTRWMMNFGDSAYYQQHIYIQNPADTLQKAVAAAPAKYQVSFYPEGGDMIDGNPCNIAFKAIDGRGLPITVYGDVLDNTNTPVAQLITTHDGMGIFNIEQVATIKYTAVIHFPDKTVQRVALPAVKKEGITMQVNAAAPNEIQLRVSYTGPAEKYKNVLLAAFQNNGKLVTYPVTLEQGINPFSIQKNVFATGMLRLTLFDHTGMPAAERLVFIDNHDQLNLQLKADTLLAQAHTKQVFTLAVKDADNRPLSSNFSVSVTDAGLGVDDADEENICSQLLVSSELRGRIYKPGWYFINNNDTLHQQLDLVMLTNGWRHFTWNAVFAGKTDMNLHYPVERGQFIAGQILDYVKPVTIKDQLIIKLLILNQDSSKFIGYVTPDSTGGFILNDYNHNGLSTLFMETTDRKNRVKKLKINLFNSPGDSLKYIQYLPASVGNEEPVPVSAGFLSVAKAEKEEEFQSKGILLKAVTVRGEKTSPTEEIIAGHVSSLYTSIHEYTLDLVNNPTVDMPLVDYIQGRFPGLRIEIDQITGGANFYYLSNNTLQTSRVGVMEPAKGTTAATTKATDNTPSAKPYIYLNEAPATFDDVKHINLTDVALIRYMPPPVFFAPYNGGNAGALLIYTKNNADDRRNISSREEFNQYTFNGYTITREFSAPDYSSSKNAPPDNRSTLYWAHDLNTDSKGNIKFRFYNSDKAKKYRVVIEGMDKDGRLGVVDEVF